MSYAAYASTTPDNNDANSVKQQQQDVEAVTPPSAGYKYTLFGKEREWKHRGGGCLCFLVIVLVFGVLAAVVFGISVGVEKGLTG